MNIHSTTARYNWHVRIGWYFYRIAWQRQAGKKERLDEYLNVYLVTVKVAITPWGPWQLPSSHQFETAKWEWRNLIDAQIEQECTRQRRDNG